MSLHVDRNRQQQGLVSVANSTTPHGSWRELSVPEDSAEWKENSLILEPDKSALASGFNQVLWNQLLNIMGRMLTSCEEWEWDRLMAPYMIGRVAQWYCAIPENLLCQTLLLTLRLGTCSYFICSFLHYGCCCYSCPLPDYQSTGTDHSSLFSYVPRPHTAGMLNDKVASEF